MPQKKTRAQRKAATAKLIARDRRNLVSYKKRLAERTVFRSKQRRAVTENDIDQMLKQYIETALWSSTDESDERGGKPLDRNYSKDDIDKKSLAKMRLDVKRFLHANTHDIDGDFSQAGHDFWLTRNGHGAGFWDGDWPEAAGERLTESSKDFGESHLEVADNGTLYVSP